MTAPSRSCAFDRDCLVWRLAHAAARGEGIALRDAVAWDHGAQAAWDACREPDALGSLMVAAGHVGAVCDVMARLAELELDLLEHALTLRLARASVATLRDALARYWAWRAGRIPLAQVPGITAVQNQSIGIMRDVVTLAHGVDRVDARWMPPETLVFEMAVEDVVWVAARQTGQHRASYPRLERVREFWLLDALAGALRLACPAAPRLAQLGLRGIGNAEASRGGV